MKNSQNSFCFEIKERIILSVHGSSVIRGSKGTFNKIWNFFVFRFHYQIEKRISNPNFDFQ